MVDEYIRKADAVEALDGKIIVTGQKNADTVLQYMKDISNKIKSLKPADVVQVVRCKGCIHNNDCDIQYSAQAGENFFCGFGENEKDVREDIYE